MRISYLQYIFYFSFLISGLKAQVVFTNQTIKYNPEFDFRSGNAGAFTDLNGDGLDDLVIIDKGDQMKLGYNMGAEKPMNWVEGPKVSSSREFLCLVTDLENDGELEIITSGSFSNTKIYKRKTNGSYVFNHQVKESILAQGGNTIDINNDGFLDYFLCSDESENLIAINNTEGVLEKSNDLFDWTTNPVSDNSGNYSSEWADVNNDGRVDVVVAKCRLGVGDPTDPRRINRLMIQQPDGTFKDEAKLRGFDIGYQSWTTSLADFDNDGDFDCLVTNHDHSHQWLVNDGNGFFIEKTIHPSQPGNFAFQSIVRDFNNDGFLDVFIPGDALNLMLMNENGESFSIIEDPIGNPATSATVGDIDNDGKIDINAFYPTGINFPGQTADRIFINETDNLNKYIDLHLIGSQSNRLAVGAVVHIHCNLGVLTQTVKGGESYGITNSYVLHFGLGESPAIDSIIIKWPSGNRTKFNPSILDKKYDIEEGQCFVDNINIQDEDLYLCEDSIVLTAPSGYSNYSWSNGDMGPEIKLFTEGIYHVSMLNDTGCIVKSNPIAVRQGRIQSPLISSLESPIGCFGDTITLSTIRDGLAYNWSNGSTETTTVASDSGIISLSILDHCNNWIEDSITVTLLDPNQFTTVGDTVKKGENGILFASGENIKWYASPLAVTPIHEGNELSIFNVVASQEYYARNTLNEYKRHYYAGMQISNMDSIFHEDSISFDLLLTVFEDFTVKKVTLNAKKAGWRKFIVKNEQLQTVSEFELFVENGVGSYDMDLFVPKGQLVYLGTDPSYNLFHLGTRSPQLANNLSQIEYPYRLGPIGDIISSTGSKSLYPYFYDIHVASDKFECVSETKAVQLLLDTDVSNEELLSNSISLYPNPAFSTLKIKSDNKIDQLSIYDIYGSRVINCPNFNNNLYIDLSRLPSGIYYVMIENSGNLINKTFIKQ